MLLTNARNIYIYHEAKNIVEEIEMKLAIKSLSISGGNVIIKGKFEINYNIDDYRIFFVIDDKRYEAVTDNNDNVEFSFKLQGKSTILSAMIDINYASVYIPFQCRNKKDGGISKNKRGTEYRVSQITKKKLEVEIKR